MLYSQRLIDSAIGKPTEKRIRGAVSSVSRSTTSTWPSSRDVFLGLGPPSGPGRGNDDPEQEVVLRCTLSACSIEQLQGNRLCR